jgi:hypothetical protein
MNEPSVLDYIKSKLMPWRGIKIEIPPVPESPPNPDEVLQPGLMEDESAPEYEQTTVFDRSREFESRLDDADNLGEQAEARSGSLTWPWRSSAALVMALIAQSSMEPPNRDAVLGVAFYAVSAVFVFWAIITKEWMLEPLKEDQAVPVSVAINWKLMLPAVPMIIISFLAFGGNQFNAANLIIWGITIAYVLAILWQPIRHMGQWTLKNRFLTWIKNPVVNLKITPWVMLFLLATALVIFFRLYRLDQVPGEMFSDHAEKLLDVGDVLNGNFSIFFPRNTGREAIQMYLTAAISLIFGTGLSFISLKIGTAICGLLTLPYVYLLGKDIGGKWVGLLAFILTGIGYWPNLIARIGLRFPLYPLFVAPALYYLIRGLRRQNRNDFILSGIFLGLGLHGYSPFRVVPIVFLILFGLYLLHRHAQNKRSQTITAFFILGLISIVIFLPLARYAQENPSIFNYRALTRLGTLENPLPGPFWQVFLDNAWKAWIMPFWDNGDIWVHSVTGRPALDVVAAALYFLGSIQVLVRYIRKRHWIDLFLLVSVPLFMLPSILSLAFPGENPSLNRTDGAFIPIFILAAIGLEGILSSFKRLSNTRSAVVVAGILGVALIGWSASNNDYLVQTKFDQQFMEGAWNTSQIGAVIRGFVDSSGTPDSAYVIPYPYWVDTRLVGINAGFPGKDYALNRDQIATTLDIRTAKLFIFKSEDQDTLTALQNFYPNGSAVLHKSTFAGKDFIAYLVPAVSNQTGLSNSFFEPVQLTYKTYPK